jgi:2,3-bisphosphoglycerate-dependent phosphoglycerate mutase
MQIVFETHSTSEDNENGIATGWLGGALSATGRAQARELGARRGDVTAIYCSDLWRAVETARIAFRELPVTLDWRLRECNYGDLNGMPRTVLDAERRRRLDEPFPNGESWREAVARVGGLLDELSGERVLVIGHVATRWALDHYLRGVPLETLVDAPFAWRPGWEYAVTA